MFDFLSTGTGKTYVHTKTIFELHKNYGFNKFIIAVPSLAIKSGTGQFLKESYVKRHFADVCGYGTEIEVGILEAQQKPASGRFYFPSVVSDFVRGSSQNSKKIYVLLVNMQLLTSNQRRNGKNTGMLWREDYDSSIEGFFTPFDALKATRPIVIIDEPHRFTRTQRAYEVILEKLQPQSIIRYGATFPETASGRGRNRIVKKDYLNLLYDLNACDSFNQGLIKGITKEHFEPISNKQEKIKITNTDYRNKVANFQYKKQDERTRTYTIQQGESLSIISDAFEGVILDRVGGSEVEFSNGVIKQKGEEIDVDIYMTSYQEQMLKLAIERHFEIERINFTERRFKIKTLALFFIDDISSYRQDDGKDPYLLTAFERLLKEKLEEELKNINEHQKEYEEYLKASLADIGSCHAGYFSRDNIDNDERIAEQVDEILNGKKQLMSFKRPDGTYNTRRFLFSKWTLKEGWDNPNVFTIAKLRSSGSEISKLQEVGRGLRLPVDENGNRISNESFQLNYIVDFTEADFAEKLIDQINGELPLANLITIEQIEEVAKKRDISSNQLFADLLGKNYIDIERNIIQENRDDFFEDYPEFRVGLEKGRVKDGNKEKTKPVKIRKAAYNEIKELWEKINQRYLLFYDKDLDEDLEEVLISILNQEDIFTDLVMTSRREVIQSDGGQMSIVQDTGVQYFTSRSMPYNEFLKRVMQGTNIPITTLHKAISRFAIENKRIESERLNESTATNIIQKFNEWKIENLQGRFHYKKSSTPVGETALSYANGNPKNEIVQGRIGTKIVEGTPSDKYLYDTFAYDSPLERKNIESDIKAVVVYGKIPRSSIAIPTILGGTYSPDFMYIVKKASGEKELNIVVETKDVEDKGNIRGTEKVNLECAKVFFDILSEDGYTVHFRDQLNNRQMAQIINEVLGD